MNRSILIVICDFLLLSLLAFSTVDINKVADQGGVTRMQMTVPTNAPPDSNKDLTAVMRLALDEEHKGQVQLQSELTRAKDEAARQQALAAQREQQNQALSQRAQTLDEQVQSAQQKAVVMQQELQARSRQVAALDEKNQAAEQRAMVLEQELQARTRQVAALDEKTRESEQRARALQKELETRDQQVQAFKEEIQARQEQALKLEQERAALQQQYAAAETNITTLNEQLREGRAEGVLSHERLAAMEDEVRQKLEQSVALQNQLVELARSNKAVEVEKERLSGKLELAETEKRIATGLVARMQDEVKEEREERVRLRDSLNENMKALVSKQEELQKPVQKLIDSISLTPNAIFSEFATNRVDTQILAVRTGIFGNEKTKPGETHTVLVKDGTNIYALCHVQETPIAFGQMGVDWEGLSGTLSRNAVSLPIHSMSFASVDPRLVVIPVTADEARRLGCHVYQNCPDPYKFQDAVLVGGGKEAYYGQCSFQIELDTPDYVKLDRNVLKGLFGKFNPSRGDLVFSRAGELLGVMVNSTYCLVLRNFSIEATFRFGNEGRGQRTGAILAALYTEISGLPSKLQ